MTYRATIDWDHDADGIVTLTMDDPQQRVNTMNADYRASMHATVHRLAAERDTITGIILTSAKSTFFAGGDLNGLYAVDETNLAQFGADVEQVKQDLRTLETLGVPVVAALNGSALGGGLEIALACHHRIGLVGPRSQFGLPEITLGLLPGGGGTVRTVRMLGVVRALSDLLLDGRRYDVESAARLGLIDQLAGSRDEMIEKAREWIAANPKSIQIWERPGYEIPGGTVLDSPFKDLVATLPADLRQRIRTTRNPAPYHLLSAAVESVQVDVDTAFKTEGAYFVDLARGQVAKNMIKAFWFDMNTITGGGNRPEGHPARVLPGKVAVVGAGMMGAGIAYVTARSGIPVVLKDVSLDAARRGKAYSAKVLDRGVERATVSQEERDGILARITPTDDYADLQDSDLVIEAVFENTALKHEVLKQVEPLAASDALLGSNTSTLPISSLAEVMDRRENFIGLHFFSPVDRMPLIEIIRGDHTSDETVARALDYAAHIGKTPIVVRDGRGFFTSRVIATFVNEAIAMLGEGIAPATIEQATTQAGYPVGALQLADELNLELLIKIRDEARDAAASVGDNRPRHPAEDVIETMIRLGRPGRLGRAGFYGYDERGNRTGLWSDLRATFPPRECPQDVDLDELEERLLIIEAVEATRCVDEGIITTAADANIGSLIGIGYPAWTGGVLQYINGYTGRTGAGMSAFVTRADQLADRYGERFRPGDALRRMASAGDAF